MTLPLKTFIVGFTSKSLSLNKRHEMVQLLGISTEIATLSSANLLPARDVKWLHHTHSANWIPSTSWELSPQAGKSGCGELTHFQEFFFFFKPAQTQSWLEPASDFSLLIKAAICTPPSYISQPFRALYCHWGWRKKKHLDIVLKILLM